MARQRRINRTNLIGPRLDLALSAHGHGSMERLLVQLHLLAQEPGYQELAHIDRTTLSKIRHGSRGAYDYEVAGLARMLGCTMDWLAGLSDEGGPRVPYNEKDPGNTPE